MEGWSAKVIYHKDYLARLLHFELTEWIETVLVVDRRKPYPLRIRLDDVVNLTLGA